MELKRKQPLPEILVRMRVERDSIRSQARASNDRRMRIIEERRDRQLERQRIVSRPLEFPVEESRERRQRALSGIDEEIAALDQQIQKLTNQIDPLRNDADLVGRTVDRLHRHLGIDDKDDFIRPDQHRVTV